MADVVPASGTVHWVGAGLSTGTGLGVVCDEAERVRLWHRTVDRAAGSLAVRGLDGRAAPRALTVDALARELDAGDVLVSMLPATEHAALLRLCVDRGAHFACTSYVSDELRELSDAAAEAGLAVLAEVGLDPGIDHLFAHSLVGQARAALGDAAGTARFTSYCGGVPSVPNEFRYRFSWAPRGVLGALRSPATYVADGRPTTVARPWEATRTVRLGDETFEVYPNRDSVPFVAWYAFPPSWQVAEFVRGTLRLDGWLAAWAPVFATLRTGDDAAVHALADDLAARYPTTDTDRDRVVLVVALDVEGDDGRTWSGRYTLDLIGDDTDSAMARCVSQPLAFGVREILSGALPPGLHRAAATPEDADRWLVHLAERGITCALDVRTDAA
jgi:hypothetical protein